MSLTHTQDRGLSHLVIVRVLLCLCHWGNPYIICGSTMYHPPPLPLVSGHRNWHQLLLAIQYCHIPA
jgi:hypothetical protein